MMKKHLTALIAVFALSMLCASGTLTGAEPDKAASSPQIEQKGEERPVRDPVAQLRGKLLYKRSQVRKLERAALGNNPALEEKIARLEAEIEALYGTAEPKLPALYAEEKELNRQIENLSKKN